MKHCKGCKQTKALTEFHKHHNTRDGLRPRCKVCMKASSKKWYQNNREKHNANTNKWRQNNREKHNATSRKYRKRPGYKKRFNAWRKKRNKTDPQFNLANRLRKRLWHALKGKTKSASTMTLLGCSIIHLQDYLAMRFKPEMTWENHGTWHIDHMMPCASFDLEDPEQQRQCFHYTNLQPMWASENQSKGDKVIYNRTWNGTRWESI